jgi:signal transduction histidine kinase
MIPRQIVFCNRPLLGFLEIDDAADLFGLRPGEALGCVNSMGEPGGCGTTEFCQTCGAVSAILEASSGKEVSQECRLTRHRGGMAESLEVMVTATPLEMSAGKFVALSIQDISHERRRRSLERTFFHDILNAVGAVAGCANLIQMSGPNEAPQYMELLYEAIERVTAEIHSQRDLLAAENNELCVNPGALRTLYFLHGIARLHATHEIARGRNIIVDPSSADFSMETDPTILRRVIGNMVKNALEASSPGDTVTISGKLDKGKVVFRVHNPAYMPRKVQLQVFTRSFSTKGGNRGIGTYSIKLLSERYLQGSVGFVSSEDEGTTFFACYPLGLDAPSGCV